MSTELSPAAFQRDADLLKALAHPLRLCILNGLLEVESCNVSYMQTCLSVPQSTLSQHISVLRNTGIIAGTRDGLVINYRIIDQKTRELLSILLSENDKRDSKDQIHQTT